MRPPATCCVTIATSPPTAPDALTAFAGLVHSPDGAAKLAAFVACHCGPLAVAERETQALKTFGQPVIDAFGPIDYTQLNTILDDGYPRGALNYWKSSFLTALTDEAIDTMVDCYARCPSPMSQLLIEHFHGAATRVPVVRDGMSAPHARLQLPDPVPVVAAGRHRRCVAVGARHLPAPCAVQGRDAAT